MLAKSRILVTGGTGSFGQAFVAHVLSTYDVGELIVFSRDEYKQHEMSQKWPSGRFPIRYFLGDIRDKERLLRAFTGVDYIVHAAALKQVPALEENPIEAVRTNVVGAQNIIEAALERNIKRIVALSTDKAVSPVNLYGATKLAMEKLLVAANTYTRYRDVRFAVVRYGNVIGSRGSVLPVFAKMLVDGVRELPVTDPAMTRFWISLDEGVKLVLRALEDTEGGEVFVPKIPSMSLNDLLAAMPVACSTRIVGRRPGEKVHEALIGEQDSGRVLDCGRHYVITPDTGAYNAGQWAIGAQAMPSEFRYVSNENTEWVSIAEMRQRILDVLPSSFVAAL